MRTINGTKMTELFTDFDLDDGEETLGEFASRAAAAAEKYGADATIEFYVGSKHGDSHAEAQIRHFRPATEAEIEKQRIADEALAARKQREAEAKQARTDRENIAALSTARAAFPELFISTGEEQA